MGVGIFDPRDWQFYLPGFPGSRILFSDPPVLELSLITGPCFPYFPVSRSQKPLFSDPRHPQKKNQAIKKSV